MMSAELWKLVTMEDRHAAAEAGQVLGVPDITAPRQQELLARQFAKHRIATLQEVAAELDQILPDEIGLFRALRAGGRKDIDKARAVLALLPDPQVLRAHANTEDQPR